jgi:hypothetical protein
VSSSIGEAAPDSALLDFLGYIKTPAHAALTEFNPLIQAQLLLSYIDKVNSRNHLQRAFNR